MAENVRRFGNGSIVPQSDPPSLADAICAALERNSFPEGEPARQSVIDSMGPQRVAQLHQVLYSKILHGKDSAEN